MIGIGGSTAQVELAKIKPIPTTVQPILKTEFEERVARVSQLMHQKGVRATFVYAGTNLYYFTGTKWNASERLVGAFIFDDGSIHYIGPKFEEGTILDFMLVEGTVHCWEEHESPFELFYKILNAHNIKDGIIALDEMTPFFVVDALQQLNTEYQLINATSITSGCRMYKSDNEIAIMQAAMNITMEVQKAAAKILYPGITTQEVVYFINEAHKRYGTRGSYFCIVLFGVDSSFPHGVKNPNPLKEGDMVLIDTGCVVHDYISDITRTYVYGTPTEEQRFIWETEKTTQQAAFDAAQLGATLGSVDDASRKLLASKGLSKDYALPGLPHRTGHGIGLDIHEHPYVVRNNSQILKEGMTFSNEPMICVPNKFGVRLEDHIYMTKNGPEWFTQPAHSLENPFGY